MTQISALFFRRKFGAILDRVYKKHETIVIARAKEPVVVLLPYDQYAPIQAQEERRRRLEKVMQSTQEWAQRNAEALKGIDAVAAIRDLRDSR